MKNLDTKLIEPILEKHQVVLAYLFGSAARGTMGMHSDIDIGVVFDDRMIPREKQFDEKLAIASEIEQKFKVRNADVINLNQQKNPVLRYEIVLEGKPIFAKDYSAQARLTRSVLREYEDTKYLRETAYQILREQIRSGQFGRVSVASIPENHYVTS
mgnify:CR=1 FL=1